MSREVLGNSEATAPLQSADIRVALQAILGFAQLVQLGGENLTRAQLRYLAAIEGAAGRLLAHASIGEIRPGRLMFERVVIDVDRALGEAMGRVAAAAGARHVRLEADPSGLSILGDREQLEQMLFSIVSCAVRSAAPESVVRVRANRFGQGVQVSVSDTGIDIPREITTAKRLVEMMGGELDWRHDPDHRLAIDIRLPAAATGR